MSVPRPFRARATMTDPNDPAGWPLPAGHAAAKTRAGLDRFVTAHETEGHAVTVTEVRDMLDVLEDDERNPS